MLNPVIPPVTGTEFRVCQMIAERQQRGIAKYGQTVADNPLSLRAWLQHALEEALDQAIYLQRAIEGLDEAPVLSIRHIGDERVGMVAASADGKPLPPVIEEGGKLAVMYYQFPPL